MKLRKVSAVLMSMSMVGTMAVPTFADEAKTIEPCEITFWHAMNGKQEESLTALTDKFNEENEYGITVTLVNQGNYSDLSTKLTANAAADTLPDLSQCYNNWVTAYTDKIVPLDDFVTDEDFDYDDLIDSYKDECEVYGFVACVPFNKSTYVYFYNKTLFDEVGIDVPTTWDELTEAGKKLKEAKDIEILGVDDLSGFLEASLHQNDCEYVSEDGALFDNEAGLETVSYIMNLYNSGYARLVGEDSYFSNVISNQMIGGYIGSCTGVSYITADGWELGVAPVPGNKEKAANQAGTNIYMFSTDENKQNAAWEYMKYLTSVDSTIQWSEETGYLPVRKSAYETDEFKKFMEDDKTNNYKSAYEQSPYFFAQPVFDGSYDVMNTVSTVLEDSILDELEPEEVLENLVTEINDKLGVDGVAAEEESSSVAE